MIVIIHNFILFLIFNISFYQIGKFVSNLFSNSIFNEFKSINLLLGYFLVSSIIFILNFFVPTTSFVVYLIIFCLLIYSFFTTKDYKYFLILGLISLLIFPVTLKLNFSYDAGLYHLPYQNFLTNDKIVFGLANIPRFGFSSIQDYVNSILITKNFMFNKFLMGTYLVIFFSFLYDLNSKKDLIDKIIVISLIISIPFVARYFTLFIFKTDLATLIFLTIFYIFCVKYFFSEDKSEKNNYFQIISITLATIIFSKSSGVISIFLFLIIFYYHFKNFNFLKDIIVNNLFIILVSFLWIIKNLIISGCIFYPIEFTCFNFFPWSASDQAFIDQVAVKVFNRQPFVGMEPILNSNWFFNYWIKVYDKFLISILLVSYLIFINVSFLSSKKSYNIIYIFTLSLVLIFFQKDFVHFVKEYLSFESFIITSSVLSIPIIIIFTKKISFIVKNLNLNKFYIIFFGLYPLLSLILWFWNSPNPRFAIGYVMSFFIFISMFAYLILNDKNNSNNVNSIHFKRINLIYIIFYLVFLSSQSNQFENKYSILDINKRSFWFENYGKNKISYFEDIKIPEVKLAKRKNFGSSSLSNQCWLEKNCYGGEDVIIYQKILGYKFIKREKKFDRESIYNE